MTDQKTDLLPCPFCGGEATAFFGRYMGIMCGRVHCNDNAHTDGKVYQTKELAIKAWNTRADLAPMVKPLEWSDDYGDIWEAMPFDCDLGDPYTIERDDNSFIWFTPFDVCQEGKSADTLEAAKVAAQADYERRILSALTHAPITPAQAAKVLYEALVADGSPNVPDDEWTSPVMDWLKEIAEEG